MTNRRSPANSSHDRFINWKEAKLAHARDRLMKVCGLFFIAIFVIGCANLEKDAADTTSHFRVAGPSAPLAQIVAAGQPDKELSGFRLFPSGDFALDARLSLIERAQHSIDVQYYHLEADATGRYFLKALHEAAMRGVRIRLLLDDLYTGGDDVLLDAFSATPNVELKLYNPIPVRSANVAFRMLGSLLQFDKVQRRMHNKLLIVDGAIAIAGGRNIGSRYYYQTPGENFLDLDILVAGALVPRLGELFDKFWNSTSAVSFQTLVAPNRPDGERLTLFQALTSASTTPPPRPPSPNDLLGYAPVSQELKARRLSLIWAQADAYADSPDRARGYKAQYGGVPLQDVDSVRYTFVEAIRRAKKSVLLFSPYLVPGPYGLQVLKDTRSRGVRVELITNSLSSNDEPLVHTAYRRYRSKLVAMGVQVDEINSGKIADSPRLPLFGSSIGRLHTKTAVVDAELLFVGSMNFDPRSDRSNTELGLFIQSQTLSSQMLRLAQVLREQGVWTVKAGPMGGVEWHGIHKGEATVLHSEPDASWWDLLRLEITAPFVPEDLL
ncbi:phospholipase D-like domain-containing protein [Variovorax sp. HJSM1_2]|uniref:phospholipase D-like domain-containing protein n=1 Tax=Variovorax sp. HJSM1_2 TaxID=3366263 RepID=UPI003BE5731C